MNIKNKMVITIINGADTIIVDLITDKGEMILATPMIKKIFAIFEPIIFPTTIFPNPFLAADNATPNSGRDVPMAIKLNPIMV
jgi:hypothetical protein